MDGEIEKDPYSEGFDAFLQGLDIEDCPYSEMEDWVDRQGWIMGYAEGSWN